MFSTAEAIFPSDILEFLGVGSKPNKLRTDFINYIEKFIVQNYQEKRSEIVLKKVDYYENEKHAYIRTGELWETSDGGVIIIKAPTYCWGGFMIEAAFVRLASQVNYVDVCQLVDSANDFLVHRYLKSESLENLILNAIKTWWENKTVIQ